MTTQLMVEEGREGLDFESMAVWQDAMDLAVMVYSDFQNSREFAFADQIKRAAISISNNIAEGAERKTPTDFARFLDIAKGSVGEVRSMYLLAVRLGFIDIKVIHERRDLCLEIAKQLAGFARYLRRRSLRSL